MKDLVSKIKEKASTLEGQHLGIKIHGILPKKDKGSSTATLETVQKSRLQSC